MMDLSREIAALANQLRAEMHQIAEKRINEALTNHRPLGMASIPIVLGTPGVAITASTTTPWAQAKIHFPGRIVELHIAADVAGTATFDIKTVRAYRSQAITAAASIVNSNYPTLDDGLGGAAQEAIITPSTTGATPWTTVDLEPDTLLLLYLRTVTGSISVITFNVALRCV